MKRIISVALSFMMVLASQAPVFSGEYTDVKQENWAFEAVNAMSDRTVVKGYPDGSFKPNNTVTYGEFIKMALVADTGEDPDNAESGHWASNYYSRALEKQYFTQYDIDKSQLGDRIPRGDMALIISSILGDVKIDNYDTIQENIEDITFKTPREYEITKAYAYGILTGYEDNTFKPDRTLSRAESAMVIYRLVDKSKRVLPEGDEDKTADPGYKLVNTADYIDISTVANVKTANTGDFTEKAELYHEADGFDITMNREYEEGWGCSFNHTLCGFIYLVKDGKVVEYCKTTPRYDSAGNFENCFLSMSEIDVTTVDYILMTRPKGSGDLVRLVPNPFSEN